MLRYDVWMRAQVGSPVRCPARVRRHMTRFWYHVVRTGQEVDPTSYAATPAQGKWYSTRLKFNIKALKL